MAPAGQLLYHPRKAERTNPTLVALEVTLQSWALLREPVLGRPAPGRDAQAGSPALQCRCVGRRAGAFTKPGNGRICLAYVRPSLTHSQRSAPYLLSTPLCTAGPPPPKEEPGHHH